jgi:agmatine deiminase
VRNAGFTRKDYDAMMKQYLGAEKVIWLGNGLAGDDTHGHVDDLCRFVNSTTVVLCEETNPNDANYKPLQENKERLQGMALAHGEKLEVISLPMPSPVVFNGQRLPASYANFYIGNAVVIVPTFNDPNDRIALGILSGLFPDRMVAGVHAVDLVLGQGTLHCLTQQQPAAI